MLRRESMVAHHPRRHRSRAHSGVLAAAALLVLVGCCGNAGQAPPDEGLRFSALTFNVGTSTGLRHDVDTTDGYTSAEAKIADALYENSLAWNPAEAALTAFLAAKRPDIAGFQELYYDPWCEDIDVDPALDFVCRDYSAARPLQIRRLLGPDYHIACMREQRDNCLGVRTSLGRIRGCDASAGDVCFDALAGLPPPSGCSSRPRVGSLVVELAGGRGDLTVVLVHGTSGIGKDDMACRAEQMRQVFVDRGDGRPAAAGDLVLVLGDLNTDPFKLAGVDASADTWNEHVGDGKPFHYISSADPKAPPTYAGLFRIDHIVARGPLSGQCVVPGQTAGEAAVLDVTYWDHLPLLCEVREEDTQ
jgi:hypothetical protein